MKHLVRFVATMIVANAFAPAATAGETYHTCTGFITSVPTVIGTQGVWCLRQNLSTTVTSGAAITVSTNNVTIDCNGFKIGGLGAGNASFTVGILSEDRQNTVVRNCNVRGFRMGVSIQNGAGHLVEDSRFDSNLVMGIGMHGPGFPFVGNGTVRRNEVLDTGGASSASTSYGIVAMGNVIGNIVSGVFNSDPTGEAIGIYGGSLIQGNVVRRVLEEDTYTRGIWTISADAIVSGNRVIGVAGVTGTGISAGSNSFCTDNIVVNFSTTYVGCDYNMDNL